LYQHIAQNVRWKRNLLVDSNPQKLKVPGTTGNNFDVIGDIHGHADVLRNRLARLLGTTEAAIYVGLSPRTVEEHRT
jgi:hypothetical protein